MIQITKHCSRCRLTKSISEFSKDRNTKSGYDYTCKQCRKQSNKFINKTPIVKPNKRLIDKLSKIEVRKAISNQFEAYFKGD